MFYGTKWRVIRQRKGLRQRDICKLTGYHQTQVSKFETGEADNATLAALYMFYANDAERLEIIKELVDYAKTREKENREIYYFQKKGIANDACRISETQHGRTESSRSADAEGSRSAPFPL